MKYCSYCNTYNVFKYEVLWYNLILPYIVISNIRGREVTWVSDRGWYRNEVECLTGCMNLEGV